MSQAQWEEVESKLWSSGVIKGARNELAVTLTSGLGVSVNTGDGMIDGFRVYSDAATALTATAADPTNPRIDRVVARVDGTGHTFALAIKAGTPAPSPTPPALTQTTPAGTFEISLAQIRINAGAATIASLTDERVYVTAAIGPNGISAAQVASVAVTAIQAGTLPVGVLIPGGQVSGAVASATSASSVPATGVTAGALPAGVTLPAGQVSAGTLPTGVNLTSINADGGAITSNGSGQLTGAAFSSTSNYFLGGAATGYHARDVANSIRNFVTISGTGTLSVSHGLTETPAWALITPHVNGSQTQGYDSETTTTLHVTSGNGLAFKGAVFSIA